MATEVIMPKLGQTMEKGTITEWLVKEGQPVRRGEPLFKIESDKAVLDVNAPATGVLRKILVPKGGSAPILSRVGVIAREDEDIAALVGEASPGGAASKAERAPEVEAAPAAGPQEAAAERPAGERVVASPRARRLARLEGVDLAAVTGSGPEGRIVERDVQAYLESLPRVTPAAREAARSLGVELTSLPRPQAGDRLTREDILRTVEPVRAAGDGGPERPKPEEERQPLTGVRALIAERMVASVHTTAAYTLTTEADATALVAWRERLKARARAGERVPTYNDLLVRLLARALVEYPDLNAHLEGDEIVRSGSVNVGLAVDTERGLVVPVLRDAQRLTLSEIAEGSAELVAKARAGQLTPDDMSGGTFTISNLGMFEIDVFTPIINVPEVAILGVGRIAERPMVHQGAIVARPTVVLSLTADHRLVDGAPGARFLQRVKQLVEDPLLAL
ncbi:MAG: 2-oxo acid dehydrogenase subunit E2 [Anaerolineae bacterium]|nr:2-oxo acid dehydrogenase subunit E2 [Anaerolineae bacterium]